MHSMAAASFRRIREAALSIPKFTAQDERRERMSRTPDEIAQIEADVRGVMAGLWGLWLAAAEPEPIVTPSSLSQIDTAIDGLPDGGRKAAFLEARRRCPNLVDVAHRTSFLWREDFDAQRAAVRLVAYWEYRLKLFGPSKCFLPLTLRGALRDDIFALSQGVLSLLPVKDESARSVIFINPSRHDPSKYSIESMLRVAWYLYHVAVEDAAACQRNIIILGTYEGLEKFDVGFFKEIMDMEMHYLPVRLKATHSCRPTMLFPIINPMINFLVGRRIRARRVVHYGTNGDVLHSLSQYGLPRDRVPSEVGGDLVLDQENWVSRRYVQEEITRSDAAVRAGEASDNDDILDILKSIVNDTEAPTKTEGTPFIADETQSMVVARDHAFRPSCTSAVVDVRDLGQNTRPLSSVVPFSTALSSSACLSEKISTLPVPILPLQLTKTKAEGDDDCLGKLKDEMVARQTSLSSVEYAGRTANINMHEGIINLAHCGDDQSLSGTKGMVHLNRSNIKLKIPMVTSEQVTRDHDANSNLLFAIAPGGFQASAMKLIHKASSTDREFEAIKFDKKHSGGINRKGTAVLKSELGPYPSTSPSKRGDPRMRKSVEIKLSNPKMSLLDALIAGGFHFPDLAKARAWGGTRKRTVLDEDGVSLFQRKNQLNRRLREERKCDPRMNEAIAAKLADPSLSDVNALLVGGFVFPQLGILGFCERSTRDSDNVSLYQRKNQLRRRLREVQQGKMFSLCGKDSEQT